MLFGVIQRLVGLAQDLHGRTLHGAHKTQAHRDLAHLREVVFLHRKPEAVEHLVGGAERGGAQQHHEFFAAKSEDAVVAAKRAAQDVGNQDQHFVAIQVAKAVVDLLEVIDIHHRQPLLHGLAGL